MIDYDNNYAIQEWANHINEALNDLDNVRADVTRFLHELADAKRTCEGLLTNARFRDDAPDYEVIERGNNVSFAVSTSANTIRNHLMDAGSIASDLRRVLDFHYRH